ncbi:hypothetical protein [Leptospira sarikeiensis]|nr:hypothetical protein [Leptospira sarikeiensis]
MLGGKDDKIYFSTIPNIIYLLELVGCAYSLESFSIVYLRSRRNVIGRMRADSLYSIKYGNVKGNDQEDLDDYESSLISLAFFGVPLILSLSYFGVLARDKVEEHSFFFFKKEEKITDLVKVDFKESVSIKMRRIKTLNFEFKNQEEIVAFGSFALIERELNSRGIQITNIK